MVTRVAVVARGLLNEGSGEEAVGKVISSLYHMKASKTAE